MAAEPGWRPTSRTSRTSSLRAAHASAPRRRSRHRRGAWLAGGSLRYCSTTPRCSGHRDAVDREKVRLDDAAYTQYRHPPCAPTRHGLSRVLPRAPRLSRQYGAALNASVQVQMSTRRRTTTTAASRRPLRRQHPAAGVHAAAGRRAREPATLHRYLKLRQRMMGVTSCATRTCTTDREGRRLHYTPTGHADGAGGSRTAGPTYVETLRQDYASLGGLDATPGKASAPTAPARSRAPVPAAELHRPLRRGQHARARVRALDAHVPLDQHQRT